MLVMMTHKITEKKNNTKNIISEKGFINETSYISYLTVSGIICERSTSSFRFIYLTFILTVHYAHRPYKSAIKSHVLVWF